MGPAAVQTVMRNAYTGLKQMKILVHILLLGLFSGCSNIYYLSHKQDILANDREIKTLTDLIDRNDYRTLFLRLKIDNDNIVHGTDTLGFDYFRQNDHRAFNEVISFGTSLILFRDSILSVSINPSFFTVHPLIADHYRETFKSCGWVKGDRHYFKNKVCNFQASTVPLEDQDLRYRAKANSHLDSLMSPLHQDVNSGYLTDLNSEELFYLMHSISPHVRTGVIKHIKCNKIRTNKSIDRWTEEVIKNSPFMLMRVSECIFDYRPIGDFLTCDTLRK
jgi:hypothetical protein